MSMPANNVFVYLHLCEVVHIIAMTLSAEIWHFGDSETSVMSYLIQNICKTSQVR